MITLADLPSSVVPTGPQILIALGIVIFMAILIPIIAKADAVFSSRFARKELEERVMRLEERVNKLEAETVTAASLNGKLDRITALLERRK